MIEMRIKLSPLAAGKLYQKTMKLEDEVKAIAEAIHYPACWDVMAYPKLIDAINSIGCNPQCCIDQERVR